MRFTENHRSPPTPVYQRSRDITFARRRQIDDNPWTKTVYLELTLAYRRSRADIADLYRAHRVFLAGAVRIHPQPLEGEYREKINDETICRSAGSARSCYPVHSVARIRRGKSRTENHPGHHSSLGLLRSRQLQRSPGFRNL